MSFSAFKESKETACNEILAGKTNQITVKKENPSSEVSPTPKAESSCAVAKPSSRNDKSFMNSLEVEALKDTYEMELKSHTEALKLILREMYSKESRLEAYELHLKNMPKNPFKKNN